jgi:tetratricopeptide (TPR) repeat protein
LRGDALGETDPAGAASAYREAVSVAGAQGSRASALLAALALAKLLQSTRHAAAAHAILAPALDGFTPTPLFPAIDEAQALLAALAETDEVKAGEAHRERRLHLQKAYGQALMWGKGFGAEETRAAFARVGELGEANDARFVAYDAQCLGKFMQGELRQAREMAETFLREAEANDRATDAGAARRMLGLVLLFQGELKQARSVLQRALDEYMPARDGQTQFRFGRDTEVSAAAYLALTEWHLGEFERAREFIDFAAQRAAELGNVAAVTNALHWKMVLESSRDDVSGTLVTADALLALAEQHGIKTYGGISQIFATWARERKRRDGTYMRECQKAVSAYAAPGQQGGMPRWHGFLADLEANTGYDAALTLIDQGLAIAAETGEHFTDPYLHRLRGDILLKRDPSDPAPAEEAFRTSIAIAKEQAARSYVLLASLSLARLYQSTGRPVEAHAVLAPALEGFAPTPEMPEIAEAQALLAALDGNSVNVGGGLSPGS